MDETTPPPPEEHSPPPPPAISGSPTDFLKGVVGKRVIVRLTSGVDYRGILSCLDGYMNIALEQTEEHVNGAVTNRAYMIQKDERAYMPRVTITLYFHIRNALQVTLIPLNCLMNIDQSIYTPEQDCVQRENTIRMLLKALTILSRISDVDAT